jgi:hypothetical protein
MMRKAHDTNIISLLSSTSRLFMPCLRIHSAFGETDSTKDILVIREEDSGDPVYKL